MTLKSLDGNGPFNGADVAVSSYTDGTYSFCLVNMFSTRVFTEFIELGLTEARCCGRDLVRTTKVPKLRVTKIVMALE